LGILAVCTVFAQVKEAEESTTDEETNEQSGLEEDTPMRQAQRAMITERESATSTHANEDVLGMRLQAVSEGSEKPQIRGRRISGASSSFKPNDKMCVMCQFLTQRIQQQMMGSVGLHHHYYGYGADGLPPYSMMTGVGPALVEVRGDESEEADEAEEDEDEADEEEEEEEGEEEVGQSFVEVQSDEEGETEWTTPEYSMIEEAEASKAHDSNLEEEGEEFQAPEYIDAVYQNNNEEEMTEAEIAEADAGTADSSEPSFFESEALVNKNEDESEWTTPEYTSEKAEVPVESSLLQVAEEEEDGWTTPTYTDVATSSDKKEYARILLPETKEEEEPSLIESTSDQAAKGEVKYFRPRITNSRGGRGKVRIQFHTPRRYRAADGGFGRPRWHRRYGQHIHHRAMAHVLANGAFRAAEHAAYDQLEVYCSTRLPESYGKYCRPMLRNFRHVTEGLRYGDRIGQVCMQVNLCKRDSYITGSPHDQIP